MSYQLIFKRRFVMGHRISLETSEKCAIPHGHNEFVRVFLSPKTEKILDGQQNIVESFEMAKKKWHTFIDQHLDHTLQLAHTDPLIDYFKTHEPYQLKRLVVVHGDPTTEMLSACLMSKLSAFLKADKSLLQCTQIELEETPTNTVTLSGVDAFKNVLPTLPSESKDSSYWWERSDFSINNYSHV